jgi:hypothetical protein
MTRDRWTWMAALAAVALTASSVLAQAPPPAGAPAEAPVVSPASLGLFVYAAKNQDKAQQQKDEGECFAWAKQQTNIDPLAPPAPPQQAQQPAKQGPDGSAVRGAARGAAAGATIASIADERHRRRCGEGGGGRSGAGQAQGKEGTEAGRAAGPATSATADASPGPGEESHVQQGLWRLPRGPRLQRQIGR